MKTELLSGVLRVALVCGILALGLFGGQRSLVDIHRELADLGKSLEISRDFQMRTFHYVRPHRPFEWVSQPNGATLPFCSECADVLRQAGLLPDVGQFVSEERYEELLAIERDAKGK